MRITRYKLVCASMYCSPISTNILERPANIYSLHIFVIIHDFLLSADLFQDFKNFLQENIMMSNSLDKMLGLSGS